MGHTALNFLWDLALSKLYANCLLSTLNARMTIKESSHASLNQRQIGCGSSGTSGNANVNVNCQYRRGTPGGVGVGGVNGLLNTVHTGDVAYNLSGAHSNLASTTSHNSEFEMEEAISPSKSRTSLFGEKTSSMCQKDVEYGITVTKVVETLEDPAPRTARSTTQHSHSNCSAYAIYAQ
ncbi:hypothetical protein H1R20_g16481, partial [Candolleomyces eurysporus]